MSDNYVQKNSAGGVGTAVATLTGVTAGNAIVAFFFNGTSSTPTALSVADGQGAYTAQGARALDASDNVVGQGFTLLNANAGSHTITGTTDGGASCFIEVIEVGTVAGASAFSGANQLHQSAPGGGTDALTSNSATATGAATLVGFSTDSASVTSTDEPNAGTGFTSRDNNTSGVIGAYRLETKAIAANAAATFTAPTGSHEFLTFAIVILNGGAAPADMPADGWSAWEDGGEVDVMMEIVTSDSAPVGANSAANLAYIDPENISFPGDDGYEDPILDLIDFFPVGANAPPYQVEDSWDWNDTQGYGEDADDPASAPVGPDAATAAGTPPDDVTFELMSVEVDDDFFDDFGNEDAPDPPVDDAWPWSSADDIADEWLVEDAPQSAGQAPTPDQPPADEFPTDEVDDEIWWWADLYHATTTRANQVNWPWWDEEVEDVFDSDSAPVGDDATPALPALPPSYEWWEEDAEDTFDSDSGPVGGDFFPADQPPQPDLPDEYAEDVLLDMLESGPVGPDEPPVVQEDLTLAEDGEEDGWWHEGGSPVTDLDAQTYNADWEWSADDTSDDEWWVELSSAFNNADFIALPTLPYEEAWHFSADDVDDPWEAYQYDNVGPDAPPPPPNTGAHSGYLRQVLIEVYEREWEEERLKRERERAAAIAARTKLTPRTVRVKRVTVKALVPPSEAEEPVTIQSQQSEGLRRADEEALSITAQDLIGEAMTSLFQSEEMARRLKAEIRRKRRAEEEMIMEFLIRNGYLD